MDCFPPILKGENGANVAYFGRLATSVESYCEKGARAPSEPDAL
jgi:hypothetical protein